MDLSNRTLFREPWNKGNWSAGTAEGQGHLGDSSAALDARTHCDLDLVRATEWLAKIVDGVKFHDGVEVQNVVRSH